MWELLFIPSFIMIIWSADGAETSTFPAVRRGTFASRLFSISGPTVWNELPPHILGQ